MQDFVLIFKSRVGLEDQGHTLLYLISLSIYLSIYRGGSRLVPQVPMNLSTFDKKVKKNIPV